MLMYSKAIISLIFLLFFTSIDGHSQNPVRAKNGMVVSASELASQVGVSILQKGGNAIDAAVAVGFALAVTYPAAGNLGGGGFMVIRLSEGFSTTIDFRETAPSKSTQDMYLDSTGNLIEELSYTGWTSSGVPGSVAGLIYALEKYGSMSLAEVIEPSIQLARDGFTLDYRLAESINTKNCEFNKYVSSKKIFTNEGAPLQEGELLIQNDLAATLQLIKDNGLDGFYSGKIAQLMVEQSMLNGGIISMEDIANYKPIEKDPVIGEYKDHKIISMGPPSAGGINLIQVLNVLQKFDIPTNMWGSSDYIHTLVEIFKQIFADRSKYFGDDAFYSVPMNWLLSEEYAQNKFDNITDLAIPSDKIAPATSQIYESKETTHYCVIDKDGNVVSTTTTLNSSYGNKIVVEGAGFLMNNEMDDFSSQPGKPNLYGLVGSVANSIQPGKRMLSSMSPTIVLKNDQPYLVLGASGGSMIMTSVLQVIINCIDFEMNIQEAIDTPRIHHQWLPDEITYEKFSITDDVKTNLILKGHILGKEEIVAHVMGIQIVNKNKTIWGASDPRGFGKAVGY